MLSCLQPLTTPVVTQNQIKSSNKKRPIYARVDGKAANSSTNSGGSIRLSICICWARFHTTPTTCRTETPSSANPWPNPPPPQWGAFEKAPSNESGRSNDEMIGSADRGSFRNPNTHGTRQLAVTLALVSNWSQKSYSACSFTIWFWIGDQSKQL